MQQDRTCARSNSPHEVGDDGECSDAHAAERCGGGNVAVQLLLQRGGGVTVTLHRFWIDFESDTTQKGYRRPFVLCLMLPHGHTLITNARPSPQNDLRSCDSGKGL